MYILFSFGNVYYCDDISNGMAYCFYYLKEIFLLPRDGFLNHCPLKSLVICELLSKCGMFTFVVPHTMCSILLFL